MFKQGISDRMVCGFALLIFRLIVEMQYGKKEHMLHVTMKRTPMNNGKLTSAHGTLLMLDVLLRSEYVCECLTRVNMSENESLWPTSASPHHNHV